MLIDYYGINERHNFPGWIDSLDIVDKNSRMDFLENAMFNDLSEKYRQNFLPYIQLHEFEGLLFNDIQIFYDHFTELELVGKDELIKTFEEYDNPEMINNHLETAPSKRLKRIIKGYNKRLFGHYFAEAIGISKMRARSPRFNSWVGNLINMKG